MKKWNKITVNSFVILFICFIIFIIVFLAIDRPKYKTSHITTKNNLTQIYCAVRNIENKNNNSIDFVIKNENNLRLNYIDMLFLLIRKEFGYDYDIPTFYKKFRKDAWGTPLNLDYTTNLTGLSESLSNSLNKCPIAVWSSGPNKIDERCLGDDIPWAAPRE